MPWSDVWDEQLYRDGFQRGMNWVEQGPRPQDRQTELRRLRRYYETLGTDQWDDLWLNVESAPDKYEIMLIIDPSTEEDPQAAAEQWEQIIGFRNDSDTEEAEFILGFVEGSLRLDPSVESGGEEIRELQTESDQETQPTPDGDRESDQVEESMELDRHFGKPLRAIDIPDEEHPSD